MPHVVEAGTDVASVVIFDPEALPDNYEKQVGSSGQHWEKCINKLMDRKRVCRIKTGSDGHYLMHVFHDESIPESLEPFLSDPDVIDPFMVPSGKVYFSGAEYVFKRNDSLLKRFPDMGGAFRVPPGTYRVTLYRAAFPYEMIMRDLRKRVSPSVFKIFKSNEQSVLWIVLAWVTAAIMAMSIPFMSWCTFVLPVALGITGMPFIIKKLPAYQEAQFHWKEIQSEYPSIIAEFEKNKVEIERSF
jgi:hypothetical protein